MKRASIEWETIVKIILTLVGIFLAGLIIYYSRERILELIGKL